MHLKPIIASTIAATLFTMYGCSSDSTIELPLEIHHGTGFFNSGLKGFKGDPSNVKGNPWAATFIKATGIPAEWSDVEAGSIETDIFQNSYQNYLLGNISQEWFENIQGSWNWQPDTLILSKEALKTKIAFAYGKTKEGEIRMVLDTNNDLDFSDEQCFIPMNQKEWNEIRKSEQQIVNSAIKVSVERMINDKKTVVNIPLQVIYMSDINRYMFCIPQYATTKFKGETLAVCSSGFTDLSYNDCNVAIVNDTLKTGDRFDSKQVFSKKEYIEIKGKTYRILGVNTNSNTLRLERVSMQKKDIISPQIGFKAPEFTANEFTSGNGLSSENVKGKYVLLDFWNVWCGACINEMPYLKALYEKTDREKFEIIGIIDHSSSKQIKSMLKRQEIEWPQILTERDDNISRKFSIKMYPTAILINPDGVIVAKSTQAKDLEKVISELLESE